MSTQEDNRLLTDEQYKECIPCYCGRCGMQLWMHILYPRIGPDSLIHYCVAKPPVLFQITHQEIKPYDYPITKLLETEYRYAEYQYDAKDIPEKELK